MDVLSSNSWSSGCGTSTINSAGSVLELSTLCIELASDIVCIVVLESAVLCWSDLVVVLLFSDGTVCHWLNSGVMVILVDLTVDSSCDTVLVRPVDGLVGDSRSCA